MRFKHSTLAVRAAALAGALVLTSTPNIFAQREPSLGSVHIPGDVLTLACAPGLTYEAPAVPLRLTGGQDATAKQSWAPGDLVTINGGRDNGIQVGQEFFVRRTQLGRGARISPLTPASVRTAGWIKVYAVDAQLSLATVTYACDSINVGDYLEPFVLPTVPTAMAARPKPERDNYGRVMVGLDRRLSFGKGDFFLLNRGKDHGIEPGSTFVVYHDKKQPGNFLIEIAEAVAVDVREDRATLQVTLSRDAISADDYVAMRKVMPEADPSAAPAARQ
jgi:hypothetical protein